MNMLAELSTKEISEGSQQGKRQKIIALNQRQRKMIVDYKPIAEALLANVRTQVGGGR